MRKLIVGLLGLTLASATGALVGGTPGAAAPADRAPGATVPVGGTAVRPDEQPGPLEVKRRAARTEALNKVLAGKARPEKRGASTVVNLGKSKTKAGFAAQANTDQYVELGREKTDKIFVVLAEFGNQRDPRYPDQDTDPTTPGPTTYDGPLHNQIPQPDRKKDNTTIWQADYTPQHYQDLYFGKGKNAESMKTFYEQQSSGRYSVDGQVTDWVKVPYNEARYGRDGVEPGNNTWYLIRDALAAWVASQHTKGRTDAQIADDLKSFDQWDRYDYDHDGDFNEPDGYIDHFQIVHAGGDEADGDPQQGEDAIWSHRSYNFTNLIGKDGPSYNKYGGSPIGDTGLWVGDYTVQPENGGLGVFAHEFGHDLGLPDEYDTTGASNFVNWWTLMAQDRVSAPEDQGVGTRANDLGAWDKLQLGWLDYEIVKGGQTKELELGPHEYNSAKAQGVVVVLPKKNVTTQLPTPVEGTKQFWSGRGDSLDNSLSRQVTLPAAPATLTFQASWDIEDCGGEACDYAYVEVNDGTGYKAIPGSITNPAEGNGIDGKSGGWKPASFDLSAYAGKTVGLRLHYTTDTNTGGIGFFADNLAITAGGATVLADGAENGTTGWTAVGFTAVASTITTAYDNYYIASHRTYVAKDKYLQSGPYNYGFVPARPDWVEHFPYQTGLLVSYWDTSFRDNNTSTHPGGGQILPIDAHPDLVYKLDGLPWKLSVQGYDMPFSARKADSLSLHDKTVANYVRGQSGVTTFDDTQSFYREDADANVKYGVKLPKTGVKIKVLDEDGTSMKIRVS